ncbi:MFS transporter [Streptomyces gobiensis]|uniref:MFS transporter n=1 Tax=Streptomyces gobiensis TaxID=2875706 RepID=UPI001E4EC8EA|nr:MFS transporter [Streptomyces gobiensis]UGY91623.1 MFS transporter [Streptomyces gobiensis]
MTIRDASAGICAPSRPRRRAALPALCTTEITSWGVLYYAFPVLAPRISRDTGWSAPSVAAAFSAALVVSALIGVPLGRYLDRRGPRVVMTAGSLIAVPAILGVAAAPSLLWFAAAWLVVGVSMSALLYPPAFAAVTGWFDGAERTRALTTVTLVGGLASTVFAPLTAALAEHFSWRTTYVLLAVVLAVVTLPLHTLCLRSPWPSRSSRTSRHVRRPERSVVLSQPFLVLAAAMTLASFAFAAGVINLVPLMTHRGASPSAAAWALGIGGVGQVLGRLGYAALIRRTSVHSRTVLAFLAGAVTTLALGVLPGPVLLLIVCSLVAGMVRGIATLLQATAITDRWGVASYATLSGILAAPVLAATALAPWAGAGIAAALGGYPALFVALAAVSAAAGLLVGVGGQGPKNRGAGL